MSDGLGTAAAATVSQLDHRLDNVGLIAQQGPTALDARTGVLHGVGSVSLVTGTGATAPMTVQVAQHQWVTSRGTADGVYLGDCEAVKTVTIAAAPGSNSRIDVIYVKQNDASSPVTPDGSSGDVYAAVTGTAAASPTKPAIPVGALEIGTVTVAAGATSTNGAGVTIANTSRQTVARGADIPVRTQAERDAITPKFAGLTVTRLDTTDCRKETWNGTRWCFTIWGEGSYITDASGVLQITHGGGQTPVAHGGTVGPQDTEAKNQVANLQSYFRDATVVNFRINRMDSAAVLASQVIFVAWWVRF